MHGLTFGKKKNDFFLVDEIKFGKEDESSVWATLIDIKTQTGGFRRHGEIIFIERGFSQAKGDSKRDNKETQQEKKGRDIESREDHYWLQILILFYLSALFSVNFLDFNLLIGMDFKVQMVVFLSLILFSYLLCFGSFTLSLTFPEDNKCMGCF